MTRRMEPSRTFASGLAPVHGFARRPHRTPPVETVLRSILAGRDRAPYTAPLLIVALTMTCAGTLWLLGQPALCPCGHVALWAGDIASNQNSQQLADAYSIEHAAAGVFVFTLLVPLTAWVAYSSRLIATSLGAVAWEFFENTDWMIRRYREMTISTDYAGDSALNSSTDVLFCCLAFALAARLPWRTSVALVVAAEVAVTILTRDSILLSVVMLITGNDALREWQLAR